MAAENFGSFFLCLGVLVNVLLTNLLEILNNFFALSIKSVFFVWFFVIKVIVPILQKIVVIKLCITDI